TGFTDSPIEFLQHSLQHYRTIGIVGLSNQKIEGPLNNDRVRLCVSVLPQLTTHSLRCGRRDLRIDDESTEIEPAERKLCWLQYRCSCELFRRRPYRTFPRTFHKSPF